MSSYYGRPGGGGGGGGTRSISMRELMDMPFDQLAHSVEAAAVTVGGSSGGSRASLPQARGAAGGGSGQRLLVPPLPQPLPRARSSSPSLQLPTAAEDGGLLDLALRLLRDAGFPDPFEAPSGSHHHRHHHHHHRPGPGPGPTLGRRAAPGSLSTTTSTTAVSPFHRLPLELELELALALDELQGQQGRGGSAIGSAYSRPYTPAGASDGGRSSLPYDYEQLLALDEGRLRRGVRPEVVRGLPTRTAKSSDASQQCNVCLERFTPGSTSITTLPCAHAFCSDCIRPWLAANTTCPVCRWAFPERQTALVAATQAGAG